MVSIAIIIPVYNTEKWVADCMESVISQTVRFDRVIIIDDGSQDKGPEICKRYCADNDYIRMIRQMNQGLSTARNNGLELVDSEYVMFLDSDDCLELNAVEELGAICAKDNPDIVFFNGRAYNEDLKSLYKKQVYYRETECADVVCDGAKLFDLIYPNAYQPSSCMAIYRTGFLKENHLLFPEGVIYEDNYFSLFCINQARRAMFYSCSLYKRRYRPNSIMTSELSTEKTASKASCFRMILRELETRIPNWKERQRVAMIISEQCQILSKDVKKISGKKSFSEEQFKSIHLYYRDYYKLISEIIRDFSLKETELLISVAVAMCSIPKWIMSNERIIWEADGVFGRIRPFYIKTLSAIPFGDEKRVIGVYGGGQHTKALLYTYDKLIGNIRSKIYIIESDEDYVNSEYPVLHYKDIKDDTLDVIMISSFFYAQEMRRNIVELGLSVPIISFYNDIRVNLFPDCDEYYAALVRNERESEIF